MSLGSLRGVLFISLVMDYPDVDVLDFKLSCLGMSAAKVRHSGVLVPCSAFPFVFHLLGIRLRIAGNNDVSLLF